jgi:hypothetical protein
MDSEKPTATKGLPFLRNFEEAEAFAKQEQDPFYLAGFLIQCWLGELVMRAAAQYAENKNPKDRCLQTGESWRALGEFFNLKPEKPCGYLLSCLYRFSAEDDSHGNSLRRSLTPLVIENRLTGDSTLDWSHRTVLRWCCWLDAEIHVRTHRHWHECPACFDPDAETRHLAALGSAQRHLAKLDPRAKACWFADFGAAAERYQNSPKWSALGKAMADNSDRLWQYRDIDTLVIALWPLVKTYNWTYRDLVKVIRPALKRRESYPCGTEQEFAAYSANVLGLRKSVKGVSARHGDPEGIEIARQWCPSLAVG